MWRWRKRSPLCGPRNISRNAFAAPTVRKRCVFWAAPERGILPERVTKFQENWRAQEERENGPKKQLLKLATSRNVKKKQGAAELGARSSEWRINGFFG